MTWNLDFHAATRARVEIVVVVDFVKVVVVDFVSTVVIVVVGEAVVPVGVVVGTEVVPCV